MSAQRLSEEAVERLLSQLCIQLGFCLDPADNARLIASPPLTIDGFTHAVMTAEGFEWPMGSDHRPSVRRLVAAAFASGPMRADEPSELHARWQDDAVVLGKIGRVLLTQPTRVTVRIPADLGAAAVAAWERADSEAGPADEETPEQEARRAQAAHLALIGLAVAERGRREGAEVVVELDAWDVGAAVDAADAQGGLDDLRPP